MTDQHDPSSDDAPTRLREEVEEELDDMTEAASEEESERMAERDRTGVDDPDR